MKAWQNNDAQEVVFPSRASGKLVGFHGQFRQCCLVERADIDKAPLSMSALLRPQAIHHTIRYFDKQAVPFASNGPINYHFELTPLASHFFGQAMAGSESGGAFF